MSEAVRLRPYAGPADHPTMVAVRNANLQRNGQPASATVAEMDSKYAHLQADLARDCVLAEVDGRLVAYGRTAADTLTTGDRQAAVLLLVEPEAPKRREVVDALVDSCLRRAHELAMEMNAEDRTRILISFSGFDVDCQRAVEAVGFALASREAWLVRKDLDAIPAVSPPQGLDIRAVHPADRAAQRRVYTAAQDAVSDGWGATVLGEESFEATIEFPGTDPSLWRVATDGGEFAGAILSTVASGELDGGTVGWTEPVAVRPAYRGLGLTEALLAESLAAVRGAGATSAAFGIDLNSPGIDEQAFERLGFSIASLTLEYMLGPFEAGTLPPIPLSS
jgi:predicted N-acetyltransferase YhbS